MAQCLWVDKLDECRLCSFLMLQAIEFEILRGVKSSCRESIPLAREPLHVATLIDESRFLCEHLMIHGRTVFFDDRMHDWTWRNGLFRYFAHLDQVEDVLVVYQCKEVEPVKRFDPMTGQRLL